MEIIVYSKKGCEICQRAKEKLGLAGLPFQEKDIEAMLEPHDGWEFDESVELLAAYSYLGNRLPVLRINGEYHDYPSAMRRLKELGLLRRKAASEG